MSSSFESLIRSTRPAGSRGKIDRYLPKIAEGLYEVIQRTKRDMPKLGPEIDTITVEFLSALGVLFGEDLHCRLGIWRALEAWNVEQFRTPLPFLVPVGGADLRLRGFDPRRVQHFLWRTITEVSTEDGNYLFINPCHEELALLAREVANFLELRFSKKLPQDSPIRRILGKRYPEAPDLKEKLVCLAKGSYLLCTQAPTEDPDEADSLDEYFIRVQELDDYICQECSSWAGMGALDLLSGILGLEGQEKEELSSWSRRLFSVYKVTDIQWKGEIVESMDVLNFLNGKTYEVIVGTELRVTVGNVLMGALVQWRGEWYWSGAQKSLGNPSAEREEGLKADLEENNSGWVYRSCPEKEDRARELIHLQHEHFLKHYGDDLKIFPNVEAMQQNEAERFNTYNEQFAKANDKPSMPKKVTKVFPKEVMEWEGKVAAFSDPVLGMSYIRDYTLLEAALSGQEGNSGDQQDRVLSLMTDPTATPSLVRRLVEKYSSDGLSKLMLCSGHPGELVVEYFLRCFKGEKFRKMDPNIRLV